MGSRVVKGCAVLSWSHGPGGPDNAEVLTDVFLYSHSPIKRRSLAVETLLELVFQECMAALIGWNQWK